MRRQVILASVAALLVAACSGDDDAAPSTTDETTTTTSVVVPETTTTSTTTTQPPTTTDLPTTVPATTAPPTSESTTTLLPDGVPPRVTFPDDPEKQAVVDAAYAFFDALRTASAVPDDVQLRNALSATMADPLAGRVIGFLDDLVDAGERVVGSERTPTYIAVWDFTLQVYDQGASLGQGATFDACVVDADIRVRINADGSETVVNDRVTSAAQTYQLVTVDGVWLVRDIERFGQFEDHVGCD